MTQNVASLAVGISTSIALSIVFRATVIVAAGLLLAKAMRGTRAARRFVVLAWTFAVLAAVPIVVAFVPALPVVVREIRQTAPPASPEHVSVESVGEPRYPTVSEVAASWASIDSAGIGTLAAIAWGIGVLISFVPVLMTVRRLHSLRRTARPCDSDFDNTGHAQILIQERLTAPITFGWRQPYVLLPGDVDEWPRASVQRALVHEMEHVERRDWPVHVLARLVCAVYWFHPLVWMAWRQLHLEADRACDDAVASRCGAREFAEQLLTLAGRMGSSAPSPVLSMAGGNLVTRVNALLNPTQARGRSGEGFAIAMSLGAILVGTAVSTLEAVERRTVEIPVAAAHTPDRISEPQPVRRPVVKAPSVAGQASRPVSPTPTVRRDAPAASPPQGAPVAASAPAAFVIGAGDVLTITYWQQKELSGDYVVRPDGKITLPFLNDIEAAGSTPDQLRDRLMAGSARIFADPQVTVGVKAINSRKVYIMGGVQKPGAYDLITPMSVLQLIAIAGGFREFVVGNGITINRTEDGKPAIFRLDYREVMSGQNLGQNIVLKPGDTVMVPE